MKPGMRPRVNKAVYVYVLTPDEIARAIGKVVDGSLSSLRSKSRAQRVMSKQNELNIVSQSRAHRFCTRNELKPCVHSKVMSLIQTPGPNG